MEIAIKKYIDYIKYTKRFSTQTVKAYFSDLNHFFSYVINKKIEFNEISEYDVSDYINYLKSDFEDVGLFCRLTPPFSFGKSTDLPGASGLRTRPQDDIVFSCRGFAPAPHLYVRT